MRLRPMPTCRREYVRSHRVCRIHVSPEMRILNIGGICFAIVLAAAAEKILAPFDTVRPVLEAMQEQLPPD